MRIAQPDAVSDDVRQTVRSLVRASIDPGSSVENALGLIDPLPAGLDRPILAWDGEALVGALTLFVSRESEGFLVVRPDHRRKGIGRALVDVAAARCHAAGTLVLAADGASTSAAPFLATIGAIFRDAEYRLELDLAPAPEGPIALRSADSDDLETIVAITAAAFQDDPALVRRSVHGRIGAAEHRWYIGELDGEAVGTMRTTRQIDSTSIHGFAVLPDRQRQGIGRQMLLQVIDQVRQTGETAVWLEVETGNRQALNLYLRCGFRETTRNDYYTLAC